MVDGPIYGRFMGCTVNVFLYMPSKSKSTTEILIHSFVSSKLDFCNSLLFGAQKRDIVQLQSVQNAAAQIIAVSKNEITSPGL